MFQEIIVVIMKKVREECDLFLIRLGDYQVVSMHRDESPWM